MKMNMSAFNDPFLRKPADIVAPVGMNKFDAAKLQPSKGTARTFEQIDDTEQKEYPKSEEEILAQGMAVGMANNGHCCHYWPGRVEKFLGFLVGSNETRATVKTRGSIVLKIDGATKQDRGKTVYCEGPNSFSLHKSAGAAEIGTIRHVEGNGQAAIAFRRFDSEKPLSLNVKNI